MAVTVMTWNIRNAPAERVKPIVGELDPDVLVVQEIKRDDAIPGALGATDVRWVGSDPANQLAILTFGKFSLSDGPEIDGARDVKWAIPVCVQGPTPFRLLGLWADNSSSFRPATAAIRHLSSWLSEAPSVVAGDFNHHRKWDHQGYNERDHKVTSDLLARAGLVSAYHRSRGRGESRLPEEADPTFFMYYDELKSHHIDYVYAPAEAVKERAADVVVGSFSDIVDRRISDHVPVTATLHL